MLVIKVMMIMVMTGLKMTATYINTRTMRKMLLAMIQEMTAMMTNRYVLAIAATTTEVTRAIIMKMTEAMPMVMLTATLTAMPVAILMLVWLGPPYQLLWRVLCRGTQALDIRVVSLPAR